MAPSNPPTTWNNFDKVQEQLGASVEDLIEWGADGKLQFSIELRPDEPFKKIVLKCSCGSKENVPNYSERYPLSVSTFKDIRGNEQRRFNPILVCRKCGHDLEINIWLDQDDPCFGESIDIKYGINDLLVHSDNIKKFLELYCTGSNDKQSTVLLVDDQQVNESNERFPGLPDEPRIYGLKKFSAFFGLTYDYLKHIWKKEGYPFNKDKRTKRLHTYESQLKGFGQPKTKK